MAITTVDINTLKPSLRYVVCPEYRPESGFSFYTNQKSRKAGQLDQCPNIAGCFYWPNLNMSMRFEGKASKIDH